MSLASRIRQEEQKREQKRLRFPDLPASSWANGQYLQKDLTPRPNRAQKGGHHKYNR